MFLKNVVLHEIYSKKSQWPNTFGTSLYLIALVTDITTFLYMYKACIVTVCVFVRHLFSWYPFYFDFHSARIIFDVSSGFYLWNINNTKADICKKMIKFTFKDVSTKNSEPTYWTILFVMPKMYFIYKVAGKKSRRAI